jgi:hypothetical protein
LRYRRIQFLNTGWAASGRQPTCDELNSHAEIKEAARQMESLRWQIEHDLRQEDGFLQARKSAHNKRSTIRVQSAVDTYREMGFECTKREYWAVYKVFEELTTNAQQ